MHARAAHYEIEEEKVDCSNLPSKTLDIDKLPSHSIKFTTIKLPAPTLIKTGQPHLKDVGLSLFELTEAQGLGGALISCVFTDREHFEWIATNNGLYRYDGENLLSYLKAPPDRLFINMYEDADGFMWLATINGGLAILDLKYGTLREALQPDNNQGELANIVRDKSGYFWINTSKPDGVNIIDPKTLSIKKLNGSNGIADGPINGLTIDQSGQIGLVHLKGSKLLIRVKKQLKHFQNQTG